MAEGEKGGALVEAGRAKRGHYVVAPRVRVAIEALAAGRAKTIQAAAELAGLSREGLSKALKRESVKGYLRESIMEVLGVGAVRASRRMVALMEEAENSMVQLGAAKFLLGAGAGVTMPSPAGPVVNISIGEKAGWVVDLSESGSDDRAVLRPSAPTSGPLIEAKAIKLDDVVK